MHKFYIFNYYYHSDIEQCLWLSLCMINQCQSPKKGGEILLVTQHSLWNMKFIVLKRRNIWNTRQDINSISMHKFYIFNYYNHSDIEQCLWLSLCMISQCQCQSPKKGKEILLVTQHFEIHSLKKQKCMNYEARSLRVSH